MSDLIRSDYDGMEIDFRSDGWFNATQAAARFGKEPAQWLRLPSTVEYLRSFERRYGKIPHVKTSKARADRGGGTWLHPKLGVRFAQWLDTDFALWCDEQIDAILRVHIDVDNLLRESAAGAKIMATVLQINREEKGKSTEANHYMNEHKLINWVVSGKFQGLNRGELPADELSLLAKLQAKNTILLARDVEYRDRKVILEQYAIDLRTKRLSCAGGASHGERAAIGIVT